MSNQASTIKQFSLPLLCWPQRCIYHCYYSFRGALPGLIGSSWSQNPLCRHSYWCWTCSFLPVTTGFSLHVEEKSGSGQSGRKTCWSDGWWKLDTTRYKPDNGKGEGHLGRNSHLALLPSLGKAPESHRLSVRPASFTGLLFPVGHICI